MELAPESLFFIIYFRPNSGLNTFPQPFFPLYVRCCNARAVRAACAAASASRCSRRGASSCAWPPCLCRRCCAARSWSSCSRPGGPRWPWPWPWGWGPGAELWAAAELLRRGAGSAAEGQGGPGHGHVEGHGRRGGGRKALGRTALGAGGGGDLETRPSSACFRGALGLFSYVFHCFPLKSAWIGRRLEVRDHSGRRGVLSCGFKLIGQCLARLPCDVRLGKPLGYAPAAVSRAEVKISVPELVSHGFGRLARHESQMTLGSVQVP